MWTLAQRIGQSTKTHNTCKEVPDHNVFRQTYTHAYMHTYSTQDAQNKQCKYAHIVFAFGYVWVWMLLLSLHNCACKSAAQKQTINKVNVLFSADFWSITTRTSCKASHCPKNTNRNKQNAHDQWCSLLIACREYSGKQAAHWLVSCRSIFSVWRLYSVQTGSAQY